MLVHPGPLVYRQDAFRRRWTIAQGAVGSFRVVVFPPLLNHHLGFIQRVEDFSMMSFDMAISRWASAKRRFSRRLSAFNAFKRLAAGKLQAAKLRFPLVEGAFGDPVPTADIRRLHALFLLPAECR